MLTDENDTPDEVRDLIDEALPDEPSGGPQAGADDDDDDEQDQVAAARARAGLAPTTQKKPGTWAEKKRARGGLISDLRAKAEASAREATETKAALARLEERIRDNEQRARQPAQAAQPQGDPYAPALTEVATALSAEIRLMRAHDSTKGEYDMTRYNALQERRTELIAARAANAVLARQGQQGQGQRGGDPAVHARYQALVSEFPWIESSPGMSKQVGSYRSYLLSRGRPDTIATDREAAAHVAAQNKLGGRPPRASSGDRERAAGMPGGSRFPAAPAKPKQSLRGFDTRMLQNTGLPKGHLARILSEEGLETDE